MLKTLIKKQLLELFQSYFVDRKTHRAQKASRTVFLFVLFGFLFFMLASMAFGLSLSAFAAVGEETWLGYSIVALVSMLLGVFGSVFNTYAALYLPKDNEFLLSLPIPPHILLLSRYAGVYLLALLYSGIVWVPACVASWIYLGPSPLRIVSDLLLTFFIALFVSVLTCILGWFVALIAKKTKGKAIVTVLISIVALALYYVLYFRVVNSLSEILARLGELSGTIHTWLRLTTLFGKAGTGDLLSLLIAVLIVLVLAALCLFVMSKTYLNFARVENGGRKKQTGAVRYASRSLRKTLLLRELKHFSSLATWMLNGGLGILMMPVVAVVLLIKSNAINETLYPLLEEVPLLANAIPVLICALLCFLISCDTITAVAVSIEGKTIWILRTMPISAKDVLRAKFGMALTVSLFSVLSASLILGIFFGGGVVNACLIVAAAFLYLCLTADFGLFLDLKKPYLDWTNAAMLTKQSMPVVIALFGGWLFAILVGGLGFLLTLVLPATAVLAIVNLLFLGLWLSVRRWLNTKGAMIFDTL